MPKPFHVLVSESTEGEAPTSYEAAEDMGVEQEQLPGVVFSHGQSVLGCFDQNDEW